MKKTKAQKLILLLAVIMYSCLAKSQDSTNYTLSNIKKYASRMNESVSTLGNRTGDERNTQLQAAEKLKVFSDSIEGEMEYLPDDYYFRLSPLVSAYRADIDEYGKLAINDDFEGKEKLLSAALSGLQQRQASFRQAVLSAYQNSVNELSGNPATNTDENDTPLLSPFSVGNDSSIAVNNDDLSAEMRTENTGNNEGSNNDILLDTIHTALQQIESAIQLAERAIPKNDVSTIRLGATRIANASLKISGLSLLLNFKGKENLYMLAASLQHAAENLRKLAKKSTSARSEMTDSISEIKIKFSSLSTGISFVK